MQIVSRRTVLAATGIVAAAAIARSVLRPAHPVIHMPAPDTSDMHTLADLVVTNPPSAPAPIRLLAPDDTAHTLADFAGQGVVLNCWATWCVPCVAEMPSLAALNVALRGTGIAVIPLSSDRGGAASVTAFYKAHDITALPVWIDPDGAAVQALKLRGVPTTLVIDRQGRERGRIEGAVNWTAPDTVARLRTLTTA